MAMTLLLFRSSSQSDKMNIVVSAHSTEEQVYRSQRDCTGNATMIGKKDKAKEMHNAHLLVAGGLGERTRRSINGGDTIISSQGDGILCQLSGPVNNSLLTRSSALNL